MTVSNAKIRQRTAEWIAISRLVVKPRAGEEAGIHGDSITMTPEIGTKRFSVKISLTESTLLSDAFTDSVDGLTFKRIGWAKHGYIRTFPGPSVCSFWSAFQTRNRASSPSPSPRLSSVCPSRDQNFQVPAANGMTLSMKH